MPLYWLCYRHNNQISVVIEPGLHIHLRGFFSSITAHVAAAVIPPSATSSKTSSGVPIGVILAKFSSSSNSSSSVLPQAGDNRRPLACTFALITGLCPPEDAPGVQPNPWTVAGIRLVTTRLRGRAWFVLWPHA